MIAFILKDKNKRDIIMSEEATVVRRTQKERKEATVEKLIDATISTIVELGYHKTSLSAICERAGVSQGGLFRHFPTRKALIIAAAEQVNTRLTMEFMKRFLNRETGKDIVSTGIELISGVMYSPEQAVWHELMVAARTDPELCAAIAEHEGKLSRETSALANTIAINSDIDVDVILAAVHLGIRCFDGLALARCLHKDTSEDEAIRGLLQKLGRAEIGIITDF